MAEHDEMFNALESAVREPTDAGIKEPGEPKGTHESAFLDAHLLELDLEAYVDDFNGRVIGAYQQGTGSVALPADVGVARSLVPPGTGALRDFSYIAPEIPRFISERCVGCMACVTECPDTAILGKAIPASKVREGLQKIADPKEREWVGGHWSKTRKYFDVPEKKGQEGALFGIFIDPTKCKGCAECVEVCDALDYHALEMSKKEDDTLARYRHAFNFFRAVGQTPKEYINEKLLTNTKMSKRI